MQDAHHSDHADPAEDIGATVSPELDAHLRAAVGDAPVTIVPSICDGCGGRAFSVMVDQIDRGAERECRDCGNRAFIADSEAYADDADPGAAECPCGSEEFEVAVAFTLAATGAVRWVTVGLRCTAGGHSGVYADWGIDYRPTEHLLTMA